MSKQDLSASQKKSGLGTSLVQSLAKQLDARVDTEAIFSGALMRSSENYAGDHVINPFSNVRASQALY